MMEKPGYDRSDQCAAELIRQNETMEYLKNDYNDRGTFFFRETSTNAER